MSTSLQREIGKKKPFEDPSVEAFLNLARTHAALTGELSRLFRAHGLTDAKYNALRILRGHGQPGVACQTIGAEMVVPSPDVTRLVDGLIRAGLASRERDGEDRRVVTVRITAEGLEALAALDGPVLEIHRRQFRGFGADELTELNRLLVKARRRSEEGRAADESGAGATE